jgi:hypothetical protein
MLSNLILENKGAMEGGVLRASLIPGFKKAEAGVELGDGSTLELFKNPKLERRKGRTVPKVASGSTV